jgi:hypothetical protein
VDMIRRFYFAKRIMLKRVVEFELLEHTQNFSIEIRILGSCQNLKLKVSLDSIFPKDSMDTKFTKFG